MEVSSSFSHSAWPMGRRFQSKAVNSPSQMLLLACILALLMKELMACGRPVGRPRGHITPAQGLFVRGPGGRLLDLLHDAAEIVALGWLERRELLERLQVFHPQLLADGQHVPVVLERGCGGTERT